MNNSNDNRKTVFTVLICLICFMLDIYFYLAYSTDKTAECEPNTEYVDLEPIIRESETKPSIRSDYSFTYGYYEDVFLSVTGKDSSEKIKLYVVNDNAYFFIPAYADMKELTLEFSNEFSVSINGSQIGSDRKLKNIRMNEEYLFSVEGREYSLAFMKSENIPAIFISTYHGTMQSVVELNGGKEPGTVECILPDGTLNCSSEMMINIRGRTSREAQKKPFKVAFQEPVAFLGMEAAEDWVLQANAFDPTRMRNALAYGLAKDLELKYANDCQYADVYFNGEYIGNYLIIEKIQAGENRIEIESGYLFETLFLDEPDTNSSLISDAYGLPWEIFYPENITEPEIDFCEKLVRKIDCLIADCGTQKNYSELCKILDVESIAKTFILDFLIDDVGVNTRSTFYYYDFADQKLHAGPIWDKDKAWGLRISDSLFPQYNSYENGIPERLFETSKQFRNIVAEQVEQYADIVEAYCKEVPDEIADWIDSSLQMDFIVNPSIDLNYTYAPLLTMNDLKADLDRVKYFITERKTILMNLDSYHKVYIGNYEDGRVYWAKNKEIIPQNVINYIAPDGLHFPNGTEFCDGLQIISDLHLIPN